MTDSAVTNRRERRMLETARRLTSVSRRLTAERGFGGFTIEEVCDEVDISRRTFFNYYASKEDAVLGADPDEETRHFAELFLERSTGGWPKVIDDLVELVIEQFAAAGIDAQAHAEFLAAIEREPKLLLRFIGVSRERDRQLVSLVARREGLAEDDPNARAVVSVAASLMASSAERFLGPDNSADFSTILLDSLAAFRVVLAPTPKEIP